ncbi:MAG TPA: MMPL family transporter [Pirellulales bacterium]|nr:MMPL family transporter [Pirellulales bacterium]
MFHRLGGFVSRHWLLVILAWIAAAAALHRIAPHWDDVTRDGDLAYLPSAMVSVQGEALLERAFPGHRSKSQIVLVCQRESGPLTSDDLRALDQLAGRFEAETLDGRRRTRLGQLADQLAGRFDPHLGQDLPVIGVWTPWTEVIGKKLKSDDRHAALIVLLLSNEFMAVDNIRVLSAVRAELDDFRREADFPDGLNVEVSGSAAIGGDMLGSAAESIRNTERATVILVVLILLVVYRAPVLVFVPLATIVLSVIVSLDLLAQLTEIHHLPWLDWVDFKVFKTTKIFIVVILYGSGTDFCLFLISRYKEELERGKQRAEALAVALGQVGEALAGSAATTIVGLCTLIFASFGKYRSSGPAIALCLAVTLAACLTLAPALLRAFGRVVFWPFGSGTAAGRFPGRARSVTSHRGRMNDEDQGADAGAPVQRVGSPGRGMFGGFWQAVSRAVIAYPGTILVASVLVMAPFAYRGLSVEISYNLLDELQGDRPSVIGTKLLRRHFHAGDTGPITVLAHRPGAGFGTKASNAEVSKLTTILAEVPGVESVRSFTEPVGDKPGSRAGLWKLAVKNHPQTKAIYVSQAPDLAGDVTRLDVILKHDPFSREAVGVLDEIDRALLALIDDETSFWHDDRPDDQRSKGPKFLFAGTTAGIRDLMVVTQSDRKVIQRAVLIAVLMVLIAILRRPLICFYLILSVLFSYLVTMGATELVFGWLYRPFDGLDWKVPIFLFVILIAVGEDYNIYLVTRVLEEQRRWGLMKGLRIAVEKTGGIITSCGLIMAGTFVSMMFGTLRGMLELGFALSLGVVLDTLIVRPVLVPAFLALLYRRSIAPPPATVRAAGARPLALGAVEE